MPPRTRTLPPLRQFEQFSRALDALADGQPARARALVAQADLGSAVPTVQRLLAEPPTTAADWVRAAVGAPPYIRALLARQAFRLVHDDAAAFDLAVGALRDVPDVDERQDLMDALEGVFPDESGGKLFDLGGAPFDTIRLHDLVFSHADQIERIERDATRERRRDRHPVELEGQLIRDFRDWAVTSVGIERRLHPYVIDKSRLAGDVEAHFFEKSGVYGSFRDLERALAFARRHFGVLQVARRDGSIERLDR